MDDLIKQKCVPCEGNVKPLSGDQLAPYLKQSPHWILVEGSKLQREIECKNFNQAIELVNSIAKIAEEEDHHPNIYLHDYNKVMLTLYTHAISGLSKNDFIVAAKINTVVEKSL